MSAENSPVPQAEEAGEFVDSTENEERNLDEQRAQEEEGPGEEENEVVSENVQQEVDSSKEEGNEGQDEVSNNITADSGNDDEPVETGRVDDEEGNVTVGDVTGDASDKDDDEEIIVRKKKVILDSDDDEPEAASETSPTKKRVQLSSDEDSDNEVQQKKKADDDEDKDEPRNLLGSDLSDDSGDEGDRPRGQEEVGELMANIFGDDSDEEGGGGEAAGEKQDSQDDEGGDEGYRRRDIDEDNTFESDFDQMMRKKKAERKRARKRRGDGIDIINDDDGRIGAMVEAMKNATKDDRLANLERRPALRKRKMLHEVKAMLLRSDMTEAMIENGMMSAVSDWLSPLPDKSLPALEIRTELLKLLQDFVRLDQGVLKQSGLGKAVMMLFKHPKEIKQNKELAAKLIRAWSRPIFQLDTDFRAISREERESRDQERMPEIKRRRVSDIIVEKEKKAEKEKLPETSTARKPKGLDLDEKEEDNKELKPGDKGYIGRARVPRPSTKDYVVRPKHKVEGEFKGEKKGRAYARLDKAQRDFNERTKKLKTKRAVQVSLEGRNLSI